MRPRSPAIPFLLAAGLLAFVAPCVAQTRSINHLAGLGTFDEDQRREIAAYAQRWVEHLAEGDWDKVRSAREKLLEPFTSLRISLPFRSEYTRALMPTLDEMLDGDDVHRAINALQVAAFLGTDPALSRIGQHAAIEDEPRAAVRLWAAIGFRVVVEQGVVRSRRITSETRRLGRAARRETDWMVLTRQLGALSAVAETWRDNDQVRDVTRELQLDVIDGMIQRMLSEEDRHVELVRALRPGLQSLRNQYLDPSQPMDIQDRLGAQLAPHLGRVYDVALHHFAAAAADEEMANLFGRVLHMSEEALKIIDVQLRDRPRSPIETPSRDAWNRGDLAVIEHNRDTWRAILAAAPYNKGS